MSRIAMFGSTRQGRPARGEPMGRREGRAGVACAAPRARGLPHDREFHADVARAGRHGLRPRDHEYLQPVVVRIQAGNTRAVLFSEWFAAVRRCRRGQEQFLIASTGRKSLVSVPLSTRPALA